MTISSSITVLQIAVPCPLQQLFDYLPPHNCNIEQLQPGIRVLVPFGARQVVGIIMHVVAHSQVAREKIKSALAILDDVPSITPTILKLMLWTSNYYHHPLGEMVNNVFPKLLRQSKPLPKKLETKYIKRQEVMPRSKTKLSRSQQDAVAAIKKHLHTFKTFLLNGVTGSGKTEVYLRIIREVIACKCQALVLIPEINLTPQTIARFSERFGNDIAVFHSRLTAKERLCTWLAAKKSNVSIIIGTRSVIFVPLCRPGVIIVDEEHDLSFKQQSGLRYLARDLAVMRGNLENIPVILGSATPSAESIVNVQRKRYIDLVLPDRAGGAICPTIHTIDMRGQKLQHGIAEKLLRKITKHLDKGGQVLIFLNRRGFAPILLCHHCGWIAGCEHCDARLTFHHKLQHLRCHHCGATLKPPTKCPQCHKDDLLMLGIGTERVALALQELFPAAKLVRIDSDTTRRKNSLEDMLHKICAHEYQILVGTQMLAKGHHFPKVTMAAILNVDQSLFGNDFRAGEHLAQLITQVAGRAGREQHPGEVYIQTHHPHHPLLLHLLNSGYMGFMYSCLTERQDASLPPYAYLALLQAASKQQKEVMRFLTVVHSKMQIIYGNIIKISPPVAAPMERKAGYFRMQLLLQSKQREQLHHALRELLLIIKQLKLRRNVRWFLDVDPMDLS